MHILQNADGRKAALDREHSVLRTQYAKQTQHVLDLQGKTRTLEAEVAGAQKQRAQMIDALKRLNILVRVSAHPAVLWAEEASACVW